MGGGPPLWADMVLECTLLRTMWKWTIRFYGFSLIVSVRCFRLSKWNRPGPRQNGPPLSLLRQTRRCLWSLMEILWKLGGDLAINAAHFANANRFLIIRISLTRHCANGRIFCYRIISSVTVQCPVFNKFSFERSWNGFESLFAVSYFKWHGQCRF